MKTEMSSILCAIVLLFSTTNSQAIMVAVNPTGQVVGVGTQAVAAITISGLGDLAAPSLGTFDLDLSFDPSILSFSSATFGNQLDLFGFGSINAATPGVGSVNLFELSLDLPSVLDSFQQGSFTLATIIFDTLAVGTSSLTISNLILGDALGNRLVAGVSGGSMNVVPLPGALVLFGSGIAALAGWGRWRRRRLSVLGQRSL
ncbi:MAG: cohesin domain-containing protein [Gammaproteobacteria bacterium]|nr:cohesin domain-containing protein [Gammaproteobacteria bacterium]